jgi:hypothetical protein
MAPVSRAGASGRETACDLGRCHDPVSGGFKLVAHGFDKFEKLFEFAIGFSDSITALANLNYISSLPFCAQAFARALALRPHWATHLISSLSSLSWFTFVTLFGLVQDFFQGLLLGR